MPANDCNPRVLPRLDGIPDGIYYKHGKEKSSQHALTEGFDMIARYVERILGVAQ